MSDSFCMLRTNDTDKVDRYITVVCMTYIL